jgi:two-component system response regulator FixJ
MPRLPLPVYVVDDDALMRDVIAAHLNTPMFDVRTFGSAAELLQAVALSTIGCVVTDVRMAPMDGVALTEALRDQAPLLDIIVMTAHADVPMAVRAMKAGARDFFEKAEDLTPLVETIRRLGQARLATIESPTERDDVVRKVEMLTAREREVLREIGVGNTGRQIAANLGISARTVEAHRRALMLKMGAARLGNLVRMATLVSGEP